jgi:co-chaperonin GroES (HSP10)
MRTQGKAILILPESNPEQTEGGIHIPATVKEQPLIGKVVDCGNGCEEVRIGNRVQYNRKGSSIINIDNVEHHFITEDQINYIYE